MIFSTSQASDHITCTPTTSIEGAKHADAVGNIWLSSLSVVRDIVSQTAVPKPGASSLFGLTAGQCKAAFTIASDAIRRSSGGTKTEWESIVTPFMMIPAVSAETLIALLPEDDPKSACELLMREQPNLIETLQRGCPEYELEAALWAAALCYSAMERELGKVVSELTEA
ncbi:MAG: hypothetical protein M3Y72_10405 [Acidobacteriota bacterium]|nr:hypothetical protein [Acidobacteriota bacterium]